ncbi:MAG: hypothetical protein ACFFDD_04050, partial [Promethearchaeota archaeon]
MEIETETIYDLLAVDDYDRLATLIDNILRRDIQSKDDWERLVSILEVACLETYHKHWLKTHHIILSIFRMPELRGVDRSLF